MIIVNDIICIKDLEIFARHGVFEEEQRLGQKFLVSCGISVDAAKAAAEDDIAYSADYGAVCRSIERFNRDNTFKLIETAAKKTAQMILDEFPLVKAVKIEIKKPWAPIGMPVGYVSVSTELKWHEVYVAVGSNMGDKEKYIRNGIEELKNIRGCQVVKVSELIVTKPYGNVGQDDFLNGVLQLRTYLDPPELLDRLHETENNAGRKRTVRWGPRTLDLDIILYDNLVIDTEELTVPHCDMHNRRFVLEPMAQIAPFVRHPVLNKTIIELLREIK